MGKKQTMRLPAVLAAAALVFVMALCIFTPEAVRAEDSTEASKDGSGKANGVVVETTTDKDSYKSGDTATVTVTVENTNTYDLSDISVEYRLPSNFTVETGDLKQKVDTLAAGEKKSFEIAAKVVEDTSAKVVAGGGSSNGPIIVVIVIIVIIIAAAAVVILKKKGKKPPKAGVAALLIMAVLAGSVAAAPVQTQAYTEDGLVEYWDYSRVSVHDPSIIKDPSTGTYYVFGSHLAFAKSEDMINWQAFQNNITTDYETLFAEPWAWSEKGNTGNQDVHLPGQMWAPDVIWNDTMNKWCMYMSIDGNNWCSSICLLTADNIEGPYEYQGIVVYSGMDNPKSHADPSLTDVYDILGEGADLSAITNTSYSCINAIDPSVKYDENGDLWMSYGSWSAGIYALKLDKTTGFRDKSTTYTTEMDKSDAYFGTKLAGGYYNSGEASYLMKAGDYWYMFISYAGLTATGGYQIRIYRSEKIDGPYVDQAGKSAICTQGVDMKTTDYGVKIFGSYDMPGLERVQVAQGHNSAFVDDDGRIYLVYHTRFQSNDGKAEVHNLRVHQMFINEDGWLVAAPYEYTGKTEVLPENGYDAKDVCGEYSFIYHQPEQYYNVVGGNQIGIVGAQEKTTKEMKIQKQMVVAKREAVVKCVISYSHEGGEKVVVNEDGTVSGDYNGTWKFTDGANVEMNLEGVTYKGVFLKQQDESMEKNMRMTFSLLGDNVTVWGVQTNEQLGITEAE